MKYYYYYYYNYLFLFLFYLKYKNKDIIIYNLLAGFSLPWPGPGTIIFYYYIIYLRDEENRTLNK